MSGEAVHFEARPGTGSVLLTALAGLVAVAAVAVTLQATAVGMVGVAAMIAGTARGSRPVHTLGTMALFGGVLFAGLSGAAPVFVVAGAAAAVLAWDTGENAIGLGRQLGRGADVRRAVLVHAVATAVVSVGVAGLAVLTFHTARRGQPELASLLLLVAAVLFTWFLDR